MHRGPSPRDLPTAAASTSTSNSSPVVLVGLGLALSSLGLRVWRARRVGLLHRHGPAQVGAFAQEVGLCREAKRAFPQDHANRRGFLGPGPVAELKGGEVRGVAVAQELRVQK